MRTAARSGGAERGRAVRAAALLTLLCAACTETRDRFLPLPLSLSYRDGLLRGLGTAVGAAEVRCDEEERPASTGPLLIDSGTPLSAFRGAPGEPPLRFDRGRVFLAGEQGGAAGPTRLLLCDVPVLRTNQEAERFRVQWGAAALPASIVLGGDLLARFSLLFSFGPEPDQPLCASPPCVRLGRSDLASNCRLASRGEAVFPFKLSGGELLVKLGDNQIALPPTRVTVAACAEPAPDPLAATPEPAACVPCDRLEARRLALSADVPKNRCRLNELEDLFNLICKPSPARSCPDGNRMPAPLPPAAGCPELASFEDLIATEALHDPRYQASGKNMRLLVSTAMPGLLLSRTAYVKLKNGDEAAAAALFAGPGEALQMPGFPAELAHRVTIGRADATALALVSRELQLSPCEELARSRRQRFGLPRTGDGCNNRCAQSACLVNLGRDATETQRRCGYAGQNSERACDDLSAPVASVVELDGPIGDVLVAADSSPIFQAINNELRSTTAQVDGVLGVSLLARLQTELDYPGERLAAHCRCDAPGCRAYRRFTYKAIDDCAEQDSLCLPTEDRPVPGAIAKVACR